MKECSKCKNIKDISEFFKDSQKKNGLRVCCKTCYTLANKEYRAKNGEKLELIIESGIMNIRSFMIKRLELYVVNLSR